MRAVRVDRLTEPGRIAVSETPEPRVGPGEIELTVRAAGCNFSDVLMLRGQSRHARERLAGRGPLARLLGARAGRRRPGLRRLFELRRRGGIEPLIGARHPLEQAGRALEALATRRTVGKVVLLP